MHRIAIPILLSVLALGKTESPPPTLLDQHQRQNTPSNEPVPNKPDEPVPNKPDEPVPNKPDEPVPNKPDGPVPNKPDEPVPNKPDELALPPKTVAPCPCRDQYLSIQTTCSFAGKCAEAADEWYCSCREIYCPDIPSYICGQPEPLAEVRGESEEQ